MFLLLLGVLIIWLFCLVFLNYLSYLGYLGYLDYLDNSVIVLQGLCRLFFLFLFNFSELLCRVVSFWAGWGFGQKRFDHLFHLLILLLVLPDLENCELIGLLARSEAASSWRAMEWLFLTRTGLTNCVQVARDFSISHDHFESYLPAGHSR